MPCSVDIIAAAADVTGIVAEGRDIGTVVAPDAAVKVYLTASEEARAQRRSADLAADPSATVDATKREQARRDQLDAAQMVRADDAVRDRHQRCSAWTRWSAASSAWPEPARRVRVAEPDRRGLSR